jgi:hypothetical protein
LRKNKGFIQVELAEKLAPFKLLSPIPEETSFATVSTSSLDLPPNLASLLTS